MGYEFPTGGLAGLEDGGLVAGITVGFVASSMVLIGGRADVALLNGDDRITFDAGDPKKWPDLTAVHYVAEIRLRPLISSGWDVEAAVGIGGSTLSFDDAGRHTYPSLSGGLAGGVDLNDRVALITSGQTYLVFADSEEFEDLGLFGNTWFLVFTTGVRIRI
ncbi:MAG: hypothetical protein R6X22_04565 [Gemmatimonadota bacterium]